MEQGHGQVFGYNPQHGHEAAPPNDDGPQYGGYLGPAGYPGWVPAPQGFFPAPPGMEWFAPAPFQEGYGFGLPQVYPAPIPAPPPNDGGRPGMNIPNNLGGVGVPPGYSYLPAQENCFVHILGGDTPPWESQEPRRLEPFMVPCSITVKEMMKGFGCNNPVAERNVITEVTLADNGMWRKGIEIKGNNGDRMKKRITDMGWNTKRNGNDEDFVWLWLKRD